MEYSVTTVKVGSDKVDDDILSATLDIITGIRALQRLAHQIAVNHGFWEYGRNFGEMIALIHSELSEALEYERKGAPGLIVPSDHISQFAGVIEELADVIIRIADVAYALEMSDEHFSKHGLASALVTKMEYNNIRPYKHGKAY